jgi:hypothetical protein
MFLAGCASKHASASKPTSWTTGFWVWGQGEPADFGQPVDVLFVLAGEIERGGLYRGQRQWSVYRSLPSKFPDAHEYWLTFRGRTQKLPGIEAVAPLKERLDQILVVTKLQGMNVVGLQLDIDSPTGSLKDYAAFLTEVRKVLPKGIKLSITALLDWFRDGTAIDTVLEQVDEFVPQFYDVGDAFNDSVIAAPVNAAKWADRFNRFQKPYRIGISTFGRARLPESRRLYRVIAPYDLATELGTEFEVGGTPAQELTLTSRKGPEPVQFIVPTPASVHAAVENARAFGGWAAGVVFFRWPSESETLVMLPGDALAAAGLDVKLTNPSVEAKGGGCVAVECYDLALVHANRFRSTVTEFHVRSSEDIEYVVAPEYGAPPVQLTGKRDLVLTMMAFAAKARIELGRVVTAKPARFSLEVISEQ